MTMSRTNKASIDYSDDLPSEIWALIFQNLEPTFLNSVLRTSKNLNKIASSNSVFMPLLNEHFSETQQNDNELALQAQSSSYAVFKNLYTEKTRGLSPRARKILDLCISLDRAQIESLTFVPDMLFEQDTNNTLILSHINWANCQSFRDTLFRKVLEWFAKGARNKAWWDDFPMSCIIFNFREDKTFQFRTSKYFVLMDFAVALNQLDFIQKHFQHFTSPHFTNSTQLNYFQMACLFGHLEIVTHMLAAGHALQSEPATTEHPLACAVRGYQEEIVEFLLTTHRDDVTIEALRSAAILAVDDRRLGILELLLTHDEEVAQFDEGSPSLLELACTRAASQAGRLIVEIYPELLNDPEEVNRYLCLAAEAGCLELIESLLSEIDDIPQHLTDHPEILIAATLSGNPTLVEYLLGLGAPIDATNSAGESTLHIAAQHGHLSIVKLLIQNDADMTLRNHGRLTALDIAKTNQDESIALYLMEEQYKRGRKRKAESDPTVEDVNQPEKNRPRR